MVLTHDIESPLGLRRIPMVLETERRHGFVSSWIFVVVSGANDAGPGPHAVRALGHRSIVPWTRKSRWIIENHGLINVIVHPDYLTPERLQLPEQLLTKVPPRALIVVENGTVPQDRRVWYQAMSLRRAGWEVVVLAPLCPDRPQPLRETLDGIVIERFPLRPAQGALAGYLREYGQAMWRIWRSVRRLARERPFAVIQACNPPDFLLLAALGQRRRGTRLIFDQHDLVPEMLACRYGRGSGVAHWLTVLGERLAFRLADVTLATNESFKRVALERGRRAPEDVFVVRNGPLLERFRPLSADPSLARGRRHLLAYVGVMARQDGVDHALHALVHLRARRQDWHALFLGDGEMLSSLERLAAELGLDSAVEFTGFVDDEQVRRTVCSASVCLVPDPQNALTDASTLVKVAEYMAMSCPIVSFDLAESRVTAGGAAAFAKANDPRDFARLIDELLDDPDRRQAMGAEGRARVEENLAWEHSEPALLDAYRRAVERGGGAPGT